VGNAVGKVVVTLPPFEDVVADPHFRINPPGSVCDPLETRLDLESLAYLSDA